MNENVQIVNKNGDVMSTEGISYIELTETGKKYLFYTLNEKVDNDLTKIYIAEVSEQVGGANPISDAEWDDLRKKMVKISHKEELTDINYINMADQTFNVGDPKKLAVTTVAKQAFKDAQMSHTVSTNQTDTPVVNGSSTFFSQEEAAPAGEQIEQGGDNIFTNPPQPVGTPQTEAVPAATPQEVVSEQPIDQVPPQVAPGVPDQPVQPGNDVMNQTPEVPAIEPATTENAVVEEQVAPETPTEQIPDSPVEPVAPVSPVESVPLIEPNSTNADNTAGQKQIITDEEALKAINVIQEYIEQEEAA